jgi:hypothetical protein
MKGDLKYMESCNTKTVHFKNVGLNGEKTLKLIRYRYILNYNRS